MVSNRTLGTLALVITLLVVVGQAVAADPIIEGIHSEVIVRPDGSLLVTETIVVRSDDEKYRHGIARALPMYSPQGGELGYDMLRYSYDGTDKSLKLSQQEYRGARLFQYGNTSKVLKPDRYTYSFQYVVRKAVKSAPTHDELVWPFSGYYYTVPIRVVEGVIKLPELVDPSTVTYVAFKQVPQSNPGQEMAGYSGRQAVEADISVRSSDNATNTAVLFQNKLVLGTGVAFGGVVRWPKGFLK